MLPTVLLEALFLLVTDHLVLLSSVSSLQRRMQQRRLLC